MSASSRKDSSAQHRALRADTAQRLHQIVEAAERAAEGVIDDAEAQARRYLDEARRRADQEVEQRLGELSKTTDSMLREAAALRRQAERLQETLEEAQERLGDAQVPAAAGGEEDEPPRLSKVAHLTPVAPVGEEQEDDPAAEGGRFDEERSEPRPRSAAGARLLATQMAVSGSSREEIEQRLRNGFEIEDTTAILDAILGPEE